MPSGIYIRKPEDLQRLRERNFARKGRKMSEESKKKVSIANKGRKMTSEQRARRSQYMKAHPINYWLGKKRPEQSLRQLGKKFSEETKKKLSLVHIGLQAKEKHYNWKGGLSNNPYPSEFNRALKLVIRTRDNFTCVLCGRTEREELEELNHVLCINHIDFNKNNNRKDNLNTLCLRCNVKINREREYWTNYFSIKHEN